MKCSCFYGVYLNDNIKLGLSHTRRVQVRQLSLLSNAYNDIHKRRTNREYIRSSNMERARDPHEALSLKLYFIDKEKTTEKHVMLTVFMFPLIFIIVMLSFQL